MNVSFNTLSKRFLTRLRTVLDSARASIGDPDGEALQARLRDLSEAAGSLGFFDVAILAARAAALCDFKPLQMALLNDLLDDIETAHETHVRTSTSPIPLSQAFKKSCHCSEG